jgi:hypothetical protein
MTTESAAEMSAPAIPLVPVSWGELIDKITILEIRRKRLNGAAKANVAKELALLRNVARPVWNDREIKELAGRLKTVNAALWEIEDCIRGKEAAGAFDAKFVELARSVYRTNDARAEIKRQINMRLGSALVEEKRYRPY